MFYTFEELGKALNTVLEVRIDFDSYEAERQTLEYPGAPAYIEITDVHVLSYESPGTVRFRKGSDPNWFKALDTIAWNIVEGDLAEFEVRVAESQDGEEDWISPSESRYMY